MADFMGEHLELLQRLKEQEANHAIELELAKRFIREHDLQQQWQIYRQRHWQQAEWRYQNDGRARP